MTLQSVPVTLSSAHLNLLATVPLFQGVPQEILIRALTSPLEIRIAKDDTLLVPGQVTRYVYVILSGRLQLQLTDTNTAPIAMYGEGDSLGEMSILSDKHNSGIVIATTDCKLLAIELSSVWALIEESHKAALNLLHILSQHIEINSQMNSESLEQHNGYEGFNMTDRITGLYNRHWMHKELGRYLKRCLVDNRFSCLIMLEIDNFRDYAKKYGELGSDQALRTFAQTIISCQRPEDQAGHYLDSKLIIFLPYTTSLEAAGVAAERLREAICAAEIVLPSGDTLPRITTSIGVAQLHNDGLGGLLSRAEKALSDAQKNGGNSVSSIA